MTNDEKEENSNTATKAAILPNSLKADRGVTAVAMTTRVAISIQQHDALCRFVALIF